MRVALETARRKRIEDLAAAEREHSARVAQHEAIAARERQWLAQVQPGESRFAALELVGVEQLDAYGGFGRADVEEVRALAGQLVRGPQHLFSNDRYQRVDAFGRPPAARLHDRVAALGPLSFEAGKVESGAVPRPDLA